MQPQVTIAPNGRITVPAAVRRQLGLKGGEKLNIRVLDGTLVFETMDAALKRVRAIMRQYIDPNISMVDELIADRRAEAASE